jgi:hypothetical protein
MRVTGVVRDATTKNPIGGAVVAAEDGRQRHYSTDPHGFLQPQDRLGSRDARVQRSRYVPRTVSVGDETRWSVVDVELQREVAQAATPVVRSSQP